jgi:hypothetical protein
LANKIKNKYAAPKATEFTPKDLVVDVKNGRLYYKSNYAVYEIRGTIFSATTNIDESTQLGDSQNTEIIFNNNGAYDGISDFTISDIQGDGTGTVNIGTAVIGTATISSIGGNINFNSHNLTNVNIDSGTIDGISSLTSTGDLDIGSHGFRANTLTADGLVSGRVVYTGTNGLLSTESGFEYNATDDRLSAPKIQLSADGGPSVAGNVRLGYDGSSLDINTPTGYIAIGPRNLSNHIYTGANQTFFNKRIRLFTFTNSYSISSYASTGLENHTTDLTITTNGQNWDSASEGGRIKLYGDTSSNSNNGVEVKGNLKILPDGDSNQAGILRASGDIIAFASSDKHLKDNIIPISNPIEKLLQIGGYTFEWNKKQNTYNGQDVGVIAQEIEKVLPEIVEERENGYKAVKYEKIVPLLIEAIKDQQKQIDNLKNQLDGLA